MSALPDSSLDTIFRTARTYNGFFDKPVTDADLRAIYDLMKFGPTSANSSPARFVIVRTPAAKEKLRPAMSPGNLDKTMKAPCTVIVGHDLEFYEQLPKLFPHADARAWFVGNATHAEVTAFRNGSLQGAYFIIAARALGFDCGPMSGFDHGKIDAAFFAGTRVKSNFLINLGHGDPASYFARSPRLTFDEACRVV